MNLEHFVSSLLVWNAYLNFPVKPSRSPQRRIKSTWPIGGTYNYHVSPSRQTVHQRQELCDNAPFNLASDLLTLRRYRVQLIDEYYAWRVLLGLLENLPQPCFVFSVDFTHYFLTVYSLNVCIFFV